MATTKPTRFTELKVTSNADVVGDLDVTADLAVTGNAAVTGTLAVTGATTLTGALTANGYTSAPANTLATEAGVGITAGTGTIYKSSVEEAGGIIRTSILLDLTGLDSAATLGDIIGVDDTGVAHLGQITAARNGTILGGRVICLETPAGGEVDIDLYSATENTGVEDTAIGDLTETALLAAAADWAANDVKTLSAVPAADEYLYLTVGTSSTPTAGTYTAGKFLIELEGYDA